MFFFHAMGRQAAANADAGLERFEPGHKGFAATRDAADMRQFLKLDRHGFKVPGQHGVDHQRIGQAVVQVAHRTQGVGAGMHRAQIFLESNGAHHRRHHHVATGLQMAGLLDGGLQRGGGDARAFQGDAIAERVVGG